MTGVSITGERATGGRSAGDATPTGHRPWRWPRVVAIAAAAIVLASCRSISQPLVAPLGVAVTSLGEAGGRDDSSAAVQAAANSAVGSTPDARPARTPAATSAVTSAAMPDSKPAAVADARRADWEEQAGLDRGADAAVRPVGCETPCPPLPRLLPGRSADAGCGRCGDRLVDCRSCPERPCPDRACVAVVEPVPMVGPCLVCDGGDHGAAALPVDRFGLRNLTAGDTVARYRADDRAGDCEVHVTASNCACVYAPRFGSVRQVTQPHEEAKPVGPRGLALDTRTEARVDLQPVCRSTQSLAVESARKALPGVALEERLGPLAVDQGRMPYESDGSDRPLERVRDDQPERTAIVEGPRTVTGFDVPLVWTCARSVMVMQGRQQAEVVAADRGTATLRLESPGRAELTLCKRAGTDTARVGEEIDFMIYLHNSGDRPLADIVLADALPGRLELVPNSAAASQPAEFVTETGDDGSVVLKWRFKHTFRPGEGGFVRFRTLVR